MKILRLIRSTLSSLLFVACLGTAAWAQASEVKQAVEQLQDMDPAVRLQAVYTLGTYASESSGAVDSLLEAMQAEPEPTVKRAVVEALGKIALQTSNPKPIADKLATLLNADDLEIALTAAQAIQHLPKQPVFAATAHQRMALLERSLASDNQLVVYRALESVADLPGKWAHDRLVEMLQDPEQRENAARALVRRGDQDSILSLAEYAGAALQSTEPEVQQLAIDIVGDLPASAGDFSTQLKGMARQDSLSGMRATQLLYQSAPAIALPLWKEHLASQTSEVRAQAISGLTSLAKKDYQEFFQPITGLLNGNIDENDEVYLLNFLNYQDRLPESLLPAVVKSAGSDSALVRNSAAEVLTKFGTDSAQAVPALSKLMADKEAEIQIKSTLSLYRITGDFNAVKPGLEQLLKDPTIIPTLLSSAYDLENSPVYNRILQALREQALAGNADALTLYASQSGEVDPLALKAFLVNFDRLDSNSRAYVASRLSNMHPARPLVLDFLEKCLQSGGDEKWSALSVYVRFTGDHGTAEPLLEKALSSDDSTALSYALSYLGGDPGQTARMLRQLEAVALGKGDIYARQTAYSLISGTDAKVAARVAEKLAAGKEFGVAQASGEEVYRKLGPLLTPTDRQNLADEFLDAVQDTRGWYDRDSELTSLLHLMEYTSGWPKPVVEGLGRLEKEHPASYIREYALSARKNQEKS